MVFDTLFEKPFLSSRDVQEIVDRKQSTLWRYVTTGLFPPPLNSQQHSTTLAWSPVAVRKWLDDRLNGKARDWREEWPAFQATCDPRYDFRHGRQLPKSARGLEARRLKRLENIALEFPTVA